MYCPSCGNENAIGLPYCNRCGANLNSALVGQPEPVIANLTKPSMIIGLLIALITLGGFGMLITGVIELSRNDKLGGDPVIAIIVMGMVTILTADIFLVRQLSKLIDATLKSGSAPKAAKAIPAGAPPQLLPRDTAKFVPAPSVTENTTRFLEQERGVPVETPDRSRRD